MQRPMILFAIHVSRRLGCGIYSSPVSRRRSHAAVQRRRETDLNDHVRPEDSRKLAEQRKLTLPRSLIQVISTIILS